jgi:hypothetical protein
VERLKQKIPTLKKRSTPPLSENPSEDKLHGQEVEDTRLVGQKPRLWDSQQVAEPALQKITKKIIGMNPLQDHRKTQYHLIDRQCLKKKWTLIARQKHKYKTFGRSVSLL